MTKRTFRKISVLFFGLISFKSIVLKAEIKNIKPTIVFNSGIEKNAAADTAKIIISGTIKDDSGNPLQNATILFDTTKVAVTDANGKFNFEPGVITPTVHKIYFTGDNFITAVRTYYPVMLSASFDIMLRKPFGSVTQAISEPVHIVTKDSVHVATVNSTPVKTETEIKKPVDVANNVNQPSAATIAIALDFPSILFQTNQTGLSGEDKSFLDIIAGKLKNNPTVKVDIKAYTPMHDPNPFITQKRLTNIIRYLVEKGTDAGRLNKAIVVGGGDENTIDIENSAAQ